MKTIAKIVPATSFVLLLALPAALRADPITVLAPIVSGSVNDLPVDGIGDTLNADTLVLRVDRPGFFMNVISAILEYNLDGLADARLKSATITGTILGNNFLDTGPREIGLSMFSGDGRLGVDDFAIPARRIGTVEYRPTGTHQGVAFSFSIRPALQGLIDDGAQFAGIRFDALNFQASSVVVEPFTKRAAVRLAAPWWRMRPWISFPPPRTSPRGPACVRETMKAPASD